MILAEIVEGYKLSSSAAHACAPNWLYSRLKNGIVLLSNNMDTSPTKNPLQVENRIFTIIFGKVVLQIFPKHCSKISEKSVLMTDLNHA